MKITSKIPVPVLVTWDKVREGQVVELQSNGHTYYYMKLSDNGGVHLSSGQIYEQRRMLNSPSARDIKPLQYRVVDAELIISS